MTVGGTTIGGSQSFNLWEAENPLDIYLLIVILVALVPAALSLWAMAGTRRWHPWRRRCWPGSAPC